MNSRKTSGGGGVIFNPKIYVADFVPLTGLILDVSRKKLQHNLNMGGRVKGHLEFFQKFIRFFSLTCPLQCHGKKTLKPKNE